MRSAMKPARNSASARASSASLTVRHDNGIGGPGIAVVQQFAGQQVPFGPESGRVRCVGRLNQQGRRGGGMVGMAQEAGTIQGQTGVGSQRGGQ